MTAPSHNLGLVGACLALGLGHAPSPISAQEQPDAAPVVMSDKDTIIAANGDRLRLLGVDAPVIGATACIEDLRVDVTVRLRLQQFVSAGQAHLIVVGKRGPDGRVPVRLFIGDDDAAALVIAGLLFATDMALSHDAGRRHPPCATSAK